MFQRFASALFGDDVEEVSRSSRPGDGKEEEEDDEEWILVNYLAESCSAQCGDSLSGSAVSPDGDEEDEEEDLVMIPSPMASPPVRYASTTSLNSTAETDGGAEEDEDEEDGGFLRLDARSLQESWFVTPPPCFTGSNSMPVLLESSPLENLLIEHPSMSVYCHPRLTMDTLEQGTLHLEMGFLGSAAPPASPAAAGGKDNVRHSAEGGRHRPEVTAVQRRSSFPSSCYAAALSTQAGLVQQRQGNGSQRTQPPSRKVLRRLNLLRPPKASNLHLHQPSQRRLNF